MKRKGSLMTTSRLSAMRYFSRNDTNEPFICASLHRYFRIYFIFVMMPPATRGSGEPTYLRPCGQDPPGQFASGSTQLLHKLKKLNRLANPQNQEIVEARNILPRLLSNPPIS